MDSRNAAAYIPLVKALSEGKTLQISILDGKWIDLEHNITFRSPPENYRIKPESKRSWVTLYEDARPGSWYYSLEEAKNAAFASDLMGYIHIEVDGGGSVSLTFIPKD